ncbi:MAG: hypothetical protein ACRCY4_09495 [Brevinema sp.]
MAKLNHTKRKHMLEPVIRNSWLEIVQLEDNTYTLTPVHEKEHDSFVGIVLDNCSFEDLIHMKDMLRNRCKTIQKNLFYISANKIICVNALTLLKHSTHDHIKPLFYGLCLIPVTITKDQTDIEWHTHSIHKNTFYIHTPYYEKSTKTLKPEILEKMIFFA